jgi:hypothetical protein
MRAVVLICTLACVAALAWFQSSIGRAAAGDEAASIASFQTMVKVLNHPRCMNCHTTVAWPTQGDDGHKHTFNVARGPEDKGAPGMRCTTCHKDANTEMVPGAKDWHMATLAQGWTDLTPGALCRALLDPAKNGNRKGTEVIEHIRGDRLVMWAWTPGGKRTAPPITHKDFVAAAEAWIKTGAHCPAP